MRTFRTVDGTAAVRIIMMLAAVVVAAEDMTAQWNGHPPQEVEKEIRKLLAKQYFPVPPDSVLTCPWDSIFTHVDRYTRVKKLSASELKDFRKHHSWLRLHDDDDTTPPPKYFGVMYQHAKLSTVSRYSAAYWGGLCTGDSLLRVNGMSVLGSDSVFRVLLDAIPVTDTMHLEVKRGDRAVTFHLVRDEIRPDNQIAARKDSRTIFVRISEFDYGAAEEFSRKVGGSIGYNNVDSMIIDLRDNPGGLVSEVVQMLTDFCPFGTVVFRQESRTDTSERVSSNLGHPLMNIPHLVILVDSNTASGAEAYAGCLKLHRNATVLGTRTFGKGIVQREQVIGDYSFTMTIAEYFAGGSMKIHKLGVEPDGPVPSWLERAQGISSKVARMDMAAIRERYDGYPVDMALTELGVDWNQGIYIFGVHAEIYFKRPAGLAKK